jgi:hypothetical protein
MKKELEGQIAGKNFTSIDLEPGIIKIASNKIKDIWPNTGQYLKNIKEMGKVGEKG